MNSKKGRPQQGPPPPSLGARVKKHDEGIAAATAGREAWLRTEHENRKSKNHTNEPSKLLKINRRYFGTQYLSEKESFIGFNPVCY
jgi:hypothetical protein